MADTCSGIYFWSWSTTPLPPCPPVGAQRLSTNVAWNPFFLSDWIQWLPSSSYLLDAFLRSAGAQRLRNRCTPMSSPVLEGRGEAGLLLSDREEISIFLARVEIRLHFTRGEDFSSSLGTRRSWRSNESVRSKFFSSSNLWLVVYLTIEKRRSMKNIYSTRSRLIVVGIL